MNAVATFQNKTSFGTKQLLPGEKEIFKGNDGILKNEEQWHHCKMQKKRYQTLLGMQNYHYDFEILRLF